MLTTKQLRLPVLARSGFVVKHLLHAVLFAAIAAVLFPTISSFISHRMEIEAAGGRSCIRVSADRKSQVRKYGTDCDL